MPQLSMHKQACKCMGGGKGMGGTCMGLTGASGSTEDQGRGREHGGGFKGVCILACD